MDIQNLRYVEPVGHNQFLMWRCIISMAHADGIVCDAEREYLDKIFDKMGLNDDQRKQLEKDIEENVDITGLLPQINDPAYRSQIVYFARLLAAKDGHICPDEKELLEKLHAQTSGRLNIEDIKKQVQENINDEMIRHDIEMAKNRPELDISSGRFLLWAIDQVATKLGIDIA